MLSASAIYGLAFGTQVGVLAVVTVELFGVQKLTSAYGYLMFGNGAGAMMGPPIAGMYKYILIAHGNLFPDNVYNLTQKYWNKNNDIVKESVVNSGWLYDSTQNYEISFYFGGSVTVVSAMILICIPCIQKMQYKNDLRIADAACR